MTNEILQNYFRETLTSGLTLARLVEESAARFEGFASTAGIPLDATDLRYGGMVSQHATIARAVELVPQWLDGNSSLIVEDALAKRHDEISYPVDVDRFFYKSEVYLTWQTGRTASSLRYLIGKGGAVMLRGFITNAPLPRANAIVEINTLMSLAQATKRVLLGAYDGEEIITAYPRTN